MKKTRNMTFPLVFSGLMIAISIAIKVFSQYFLLAGAMIVRIDFFGAFEKMPGMLFGPLYGGITGALVDFLGFLMTNKTPTGYIPVLTVTAFLNVGLFAFIWKILSKGHNKVIMRSYVMIISVLGIMGIINTIVLKAYRSTWWAQYMLQFENQQIVFTTLLIGIAGVGFLLLVVNQVLKKVNEKSAISEYYLKLVIAIGIPGLLTTLIDTEILRLFIPVLADRAFMVLLIPRLVAKLIEVFLDAYIMALLYHIIRPIYFNKTNTK